MSQQAKVCWPRRKGVVGVHVNTFSEFASAAPGVNTVTFGL